MKKILTLLIAVFLLLSPALAHDEGEAHPHGGDSTTLASPFVPCTPTGGCGSVEGAFSFDVFLSQPSVEHKIDYVGQYLILPNFLLISIVLFLIFALPFIIIKWRQPKKRREILVPALKLLGIYVAVLIILYSVPVYYSEQADKGIVICGDDGCKIAMHIHSEIHVTQCGMPLNMPKDVGPLAASHTHKETNIIHWHDTTTYDKENEEIIDTSELTIRDFLKNIGVPFADECMNGTCNEDMCNEEEGEWKMWVNKERKEELVDYVWKDADVIHLIFQEKSKIAYPEGLDWEFSGP